MNRAQLTGYIVTEPDFRDVGEQKCASFRILVPRGTKDSTPNAENKYTGAFYSVETWGKTAETLRQYFKKGDPIEVDGLLMTEKYNNKEGVSVEQVRIASASIGFAPKARDNENASNTSASSEQREPINASSEETNPWAVTK